MRATNPHQIESDSLASELIRGHLRATSEERRQISNGAIAMIAALIVLPLALLLLSGAGA